MKLYVVMINYGSEGWKIWKECDSFDEAILAREEGLGNGNHQVVIFKPVKWKNSEVL